MLPYKYAKRYKYPHLAPNDTEIWEKFIDAYPDRFDSVDYDFALGGSSLATPLSQTELGDKMLRIYQRRIDVIAQSGDETFIIEVKPKAGTSALGQVLGYCELYKEYVDPTIKTTAVVITDSISPDMRMLADRMGVLLYVVG